VRLVRVNLEVPTRELRVKRTKPAASSMHAHAAWALPDPSAARHARVVLSYSGPLS
jgi:hypothetical protein